MVDLSLLGGAAANTPESVKARIAAARLLQQSAAANTGPYTSGGVTALKAIGGLLGGLQERQAVQDEVQGRMSGNAQLLTLADALRNGAPTNYGPSAAAVAGQSPATGIPGSAAVAGASNPGSYDPKATEALIRSRAPSFGIDPDTAVKVARSEGLNVYHGDGGSSFGPFQLHYGGVAGGGNSVGGLGDTFTKKTGLDARDPSTVPQQVDFALGEAAKGGWGPWHGAQRVGLDNFAGIGGQRSASADLPAPNAQPVASNALPPGITPDMVSAPPQAPASDPSLSPTPMAQQGNDVGGPQPSPQLMAQLLSNGAPLQGSGSMLPSDPPLPPPGAQSGTQPGNPFGALPPSMAQAPASVGASNPDAAANLSPNGAMMAAMGPNGLDPAMASALAARLRAGALPANGLSTDQSPGFDNIAGDGTMQSTGLVKSGDASVPGFTGTYGRGLQDRITGTLPGPDQLAGGPGFPSTPAPSAPVAAASRQPATQPTSPDPSLPQTGPMPPPGAQTLAAAQPNPDAPAPNATPAGPAPVPPQVMARLLAQQPMGMQRDGGGDAQSATAFLRGQDPGSTPPSYTTPGARALAGQTATSVPQAPQQDAGGPLDGIGRLFGMGGPSGSGLGGMLGNLPVIGGLLGGQSGGFGSAPSPTSTAASSPAYGGQGAGQGFAPGGQGAQPAAAPASQGGGLGQMRAAAGAILSNPYASPEAQAAASKVLFSQPQLEKMEDGTLVSFDPLTRQSTVVGRYGKSVDLAPGHALRDPYSGAPIGATQPENPKFSMNRDGIVLNDNTGEVKNGGGGYRFLTQDEKRAQGLPLDQPIQVGPNGQVHGTSGVNVNVGGEQNTYDQAMAKTLSDNHVSLMNGVDANRTKLRDLNLMSGALQRLQQNGGATGVGAQEKLHIESAINTAANTLGLGQQFQLDDPEVIGKVSRQISGAAAKDIGGARTTNFDMQQMLEANPGLALSPTGNQRMLGIAQQVAQRNIDVGQQMQDAAAAAVQQGKRVDPVAMEAIRANYDAQHHIVDPITGQDISASPKLPEFQRQGSAASPSTPTGAAQGPNQATPTSAPPTLTPDQARAAPPGTVYMTNDGRRLVR